MCIRDSGKYACVPNSRKEKVRIGGKTNLGDWHDFDFEFIASVIDMDLCNTFFQVGNVFLKQNKGVPMGSPISPILAVLVAAYYEHTFVTTEESRGVGVEKRMRGSRYMYVDDIIVLVGYDGE